jgi:hypothetical protein
MPGSAVFLPELVELIRRCRMARNALSHGNLLVAVPENHSMSLLAFPAQRFSTECRYTSDSCALFCTHQKLNSFVFNRFRILSQKHPGVDGTTTLIPRRNSVRGGRRVPRPSRIDGVEDVVMALNHHTELLNLRRSSRRQCQPHIVARAPQVFASIVRDSPIR